MNFFETADTDADTDMDFLKNRGHEHRTDSPRTRLSADLWLEIDEKEIWLEREKRI